MMTQVNRFNTVKLKSPVDLSFQERVMHSLDMWKENITDNDKLQSMFDHFKKYVDRENIGNDDTTKPISPEALKTELLNQFENSLQTHINDMKKDIIRFMEDQDVRANAITKTMNMFSDWDENLSYVTFGHFSKNYLYYICALVPNYIINGNESKQNINVLNLMREDAERLKHTLDEKYDNLSEFKKDPYLIPFMKRIKTSLKPMFDFLSNFYGFFPQDRQSLYGRYFQFCLLFIFYYFVQTSYDDTLLVDIFQKIRLDEAEEGGEDDELDGEMKVADRGSVQTRLLKLMQTLLKGKNVYDRDKKTTIFTYQNIRKNVERLEGAEKKRMMDGFKNIKDIKTRRSELLLKKYHLGKFFVDPKVIKTYGKRRDKMLNTEDKTETDFLYGPNEVTEEDVEDLMDEFGQMNFEETLEVLPKKDGYNVLDEYDEEEYKDGELDDEEYDDEAHFTMAGEDDDAYDIAENVGGR